MAKQKNDIAKLSNAFSTGGGGGSFERRIQAVFLLVLLVDGVSPILNAPIERIAFQARQLGHAVDDMVVFSASGAKLLCQMKHSLSVTEKDATFQEVMRAAWHDFCAKTFSKERDKIALFTGFIAKDSTNALRYTRFSEELQRIAEYYLAEAQENARYYAEEREAKMAE